MLDTNIEKKIEKYKKKIESTKLDYDNAMCQLNILKEEIKNLEFKEVENKVYVKKLLESSKPKDKKLYEEVVKIIKERMNIKSVDNIKTENNIYSDNATINDNLSSNTNNVSNNKSNNFNNNSNKKTKGFFNILK